MIRAIYRWRGAKFAPFMGRRGKTIDLGCGSGDFSVRMAKIGWDSSAHDVYESGGSEARAHNIPVYCCQVEGLPSAAGTDFDLVTSWHALEHEHNPARILRAAHELLRPGGEIVIAIPNYGSLERRLIGVKWDALQPPIHLLHFTKQSMHYLLADAGFESIRCETGGSYYHRSSKFPGPIAKAVSRIISFAQSRLGFGAELRVSARKAQTKGA
jgi:SAM-dependent methyltransferase